MREKLTESEMQEKQEKRIRKKKIAAKTALIAGLAVSSVAIPFYGDLYGDASGLVSGLWQGGSSGLDVARGNADKMRVAGEIAKNTFNGQDATALYQEGIRVDLKLRNDQAMLDKSVNDINLNAKSIFENPASAFAAGGAGLLLVSYKLGRNK